ncbi:MAG: glycoside hydrolase family 3 N-terminal domain-containing protein [Rikenellaceae bacterium]
MFKNIISLLCASFATFTLSAQELLPYQNQELSPKERAADLVSRMTLKEKASQMVNEATAIDRLGVPSYMWWNECLHGVARSGNATIFPQSVGVAASFDTDLVYRMTNAISDEARSLYLQAEAKGNDGKYTGLTFYSPNINIYRDPRWGRGQETFGEDPYLTSQLGVAYVKGLQGDDEKYLKTAACAKHFAAHSGPEALRHGFNVIVSWKDLYETYLPAFKALVKDADVESVMAAYSRTNGEVCAASETLLVDILKKEWGFDGYLTSDCGALWNFINNHKICNSAEEAAAMALNAGLNLECGALYLNAIPKAVEKGLVEESTVDVLLTRLMETRFKLGLFDDKEKVKYNEVSQALVSNNKHKQIAYEAAVKSMVLLENKNSTLPLTDKVNYIYVTGPFANQPDALIGNYYGANDMMTTFYEGIAANMPKGTSIQYRPGVMPTHFGYNDWTVKEAPEADIVVACVGLTNMLEGEGTDAIASETQGDMIDNMLPEAQMKFLRTLRENIDKENKKLGSDKKLIVVVASGTPLIMTEVGELSDALIYAWYPGQAGGYALADILYGNVSPSARTPLTFIKNIEQLPPFENYSMEGRTYKYMTCEPLYPFGYGLSYSEFKYSNLECQESVKAGEKLSLSVEVKNIGKYDADEVVQLYVATQNSGNGEPIRRLANFKRISLKAGESKIVDLEVTPTFMSTLTDDKRREVQKGNLTISVGGGQPIKSTKAYVETTCNVKGNKEIEL